MHLRTCAASAWSCTTSALTEGTHGLTANQTIGAQTTVDSAVRLVRIDTTAPNAPVLTTPAAGSSTNNKTPVTGGSCEPGATVTVINGAAWCSGTCTLARTFSCTPATQTDGSKTLTATQVDVGGKTSPVSASLTFTLDTAAPAAPTLTAPTAGVDPGTATPTYTGACETGATVKIIENLSTVVCTTTCAAGAYTCVSSPLATGSHTVQAKQVDPAGNNSPFTAQLTFPITVLPNLPPTLSAPTQGQVLTVSAPTIAMSCVTGQPVTVHEGATAICSGTCAASAYSCTPTLADGTHAITASQTQSGVESPLSPVRTFIVDTTAPLAPVITAPVNGGNANGTTPTVTGTCETGTTVRVYEGATVRCTTACAASAFTCNSATLTAGSHTFLARQTDVAGNVSPDSNVVTFVITICGNGTRETGEGCDDANLTSGDGCSATCTVETGYACVETAGLSSCGCTADSSCQATQYCASGTPNTCTARLPAGTAIPAGHGTCATPGTLGSAATACVTGQCNATTNTCALALGQICTSAAQCVTNACTGGVCVDSMFLTTTAGSSTYVGNHPAVVVDPSLTVTGSATLANAVMSIGAGFSPNNDRLNYTTMNGITGAYDAVRGTLTLSGTGTTAQYEAALRSVTFSNSSTAPLAGTRVVNVSIGNAVSNPDNGHFYEFVAYNGTWVSAKAQAEARTYLGLKGYLASITTAAENTFIRSKLTADGWIGARANPETSFPRSWYWQGGPDNNVQFCTNNSSGVWAITNSLFANWAGGEPNNMGGEGCGQIYFAAGGTWNDLSCTGTSLGGYVVEYGGSVGDPLLQVTGTRNVDVIFTATAIAGAGATLTYTQGDAATLVAPALTVVGTNAIASATVTFTAGYVAAEDTLAMPPTNGLTAAFAGGTLTISGAGTTADYQAAFRAVTYVNSVTPRPTTALRTLRFLVDGVSTTRALQVRALPLVVVTSSGSPTPLGQSVTLTATLTPLASTGTVQFLDGATPLATVALSAGRATYTSSALSAGSHTITANYSGDTERLAASGTFTQVISLLPPTIAAPTAGQAVNTPAITLVCETGRTETVYEGAAVLCTGACVASAYTCSATLSEGPHTVTATQTAFGYESAPSAARTFTYDSLVPAAPVLSAPVDGSGSTNPTPTVSGSCEAGITVSVYEGATLRCTTTCGAGTFSCTSSAMSVGSHVLLARQVDAAGNVSADSAAITVGVSLCGNGTMELGEACDDGNTKAGDGCSAVCAKEPGFTCTGTPSTCGAVCGDGVQTATEACDDGNTTAGDGCSATCTIEAGYLCSNTSPNLVTNGGFDDGNTGFTSTLNYMVGSVNSLADQYSISTGNAWRPDVCAGVADAEHSVANKSLYFNAGSDPTQVLYQTDVAVTAGKKYILEAYAMSWTPSAPPRMVISLGGVDLTAEFTSVVCNANTPWTRISASYEATTTGTITLKVYDRETAAVGNDGALDGFSVREAVASVCAKPTLDALAVIAQPNQAAFPLSGACVVGAGNVTVSVGAIASTVPCTAGTWSATLDLHTVADAASVTVSVEQSNASGTAVNTATTSKDTVAAPPAIEAPLAAAYLKTATPDFSGTCEDGATVKVYEGSTLLCSGACASAAYTCTSTVTLTDGSHTVLATDTDALGNVSVDSGSVSFIVDTVAPDAPAPLLPVAGLRTNVVQPTFSGTCEVAALVGVYEGTTLLCSAVCDAAGTFTCQSSALAEGLHSYVTRQTDLAGNTGADSLSRDVIIDVTPPDAPSVSAPSAGLYTNDNTPNVWGSCETDSTVRVYEGALELCSAPCLVAAFSCDAATLADGSHTLQVRQTDVAGNTSAASADRAFTVDTQVAPPTWTTPVDGAFLSTLTPAFAGGCETEATVTVSEGTTVLCTATCASSAWSCTSSALPEGAHTVTLGQVDHAANVSATVDRSFTLDVTNPAAPVIASPVEGDFIQARRTAVSGSCEDFAQVEVRSGSTVLCSATCAAGAFTCTTVTQPEGSYTLTARQTDRAGNVGPDSTGAGIVFDVTAPPAPQLTTPSLGLVTAVASQALAGSCEAFAHVTVKEGSTTLCDTTCTAGGTFACTATTYAEGRHTLVTQQTDRALNASLEGGHFFTVDTLAPVVPGISAPVAKAALNTGAPTIKGTGEVGATVDVYVDGRKLCTTTVDQAGLWSCAVTGLTDGPHLVQAASFDGVRNTSAMSANVPFTVDTVAPSAPTIALPLNGQAVSAWTSFSGRGEPGTTVTVKVDGAVTCSAVVDRTGAWACLANAALSTAVHRAIASAVDAAGNASPASGPVDFVVSGSAAPGAPVLASPKAGDALDATKPTFSGRAEPGSTVSVKVDGVEVCTTTASATGDYSCTATVALTDGAHTATVTATNGHGSSLPSNGVGFTVDTQAPVAPVLTQPAAASDVGPRPVFAGTAEAGSTVVVKVDGQAACTAVTDATGHFACSSTLSLTPGAHSATAVATDAAGHASPASASRAFTVKGGLVPASPVVIAPTEGAALKDGNVVFTGTAEPGSTVKVSIDGHEVCTAIVGPSGEWTCTGPGTTDGQHTYTATTTSPAGTSAASSTGHFGLDTQAPAAPVVTSPAAASTTGPWPSYSGTAEAGSQVSVKVDGLEVCTATASATGAFTCSSKVPLAPGAHSVTATATDASGWTSPASAAQAFTVSLTAPTLTSPKMSQSVGAAKPTFSGGGEPGTTMSVVVDGQVVCTSVVDAQGQWSCTSSVTLADGPHAAYASSDDGYGHVKKSQLTYFGVDTTKPAAPVTGSPTAGQEVLGSNVTFSGTAEPGSTVTVSVDGQEVCTAVVDANGNWSCTATNVAGGTHTVTTTTTDPAGNTSTSSVGVGFTNVTTLSAPVISTPAEGESLNGPTVNFAGTATAHTTVAVLDEGGAAICTAKVDAAGAWHCTADLAAGNRVVTAKATSAGLATGESGPRAFTVLQDVRMYGGGIGCTQSGGSPALLGLLAAAAMLLRRRR